jgi:glycosyltransferase involved in cell wall biosynthesis
VSKSITHVVLGPTSELHAGIHGGLAERPPPGVRYWNMPHVHHHTFATASTVNLDPFEQFSLHEAVEYDWKLLVGLTRVGVHSSRLPVSGGLPWVVDADCLLATLRYSRPYIVGKSNSFDIHPSNEENCLWRSRLMLKDYVAPRCKGLLFRSDFYRKVFLKYVAGIGVLSPIELDSLANKTQVLYPTMGPVRAPRCAGSAVTLLYVGRTFEDKGGTIAARVFAALEQPGAPRTRRIWVGPCPDNVRSQLSSVHFWPFLDRETYLSLLPEADIFFSPTTFESYGMALVEAACHSLALVTTCGPGMEHIKELFGEGENVLYADNAWPMGERSRVFLNHISRLVVNRDMLLKMKSASWKLASTGPLSLDTRNKILLAFYKRLNITTSSDRLFAETAAVDNELGSLVRRSFHPELLMEKSSKQIGTVARRFRVS